MRVMKCDMFSRWRERERERCAEGGKDSKQLKQPRFSVGRQYIYIYVYVYIYTHTRILRGSPIQYNICMVRRKSSEHWREWAARIDGWRAFASHLLMSSVNSRRHVFLLFLFSFYILQPPILSYLPPLRSTLYSTPAHSFFFLLFIYFSWANCLGTAWNSGWKFIIYTSYSILYAGCIIIVGSGGTWFVVDNISYFTDL